MFDVDFEMVLKICCRCIYVVNPFIVSPIPPSHNPTKESLAIDRAKEEAKKDEEKRVQQEIEREELMQRAEEKRIAHEKELRTAIQKSIQVLTTVCDDAFG